MIETDATNIKNTLFHKVDNTIYEILVKQADNAEESLEDILVRLIAEDPITGKGEYANG